jgi:uncharacterized RmlC-like cupin family protein
MFSRHPTSRLRSPVAIGAFFTVALIASPLFANAQSTSSIDEQRLMPNEFDFSVAGQGGTGTSGVQGIRTLVLKGDPKAGGLYTILLSVPAHTKIAAHNHPDERVATVISGVWRIGYGNTFDESKLKALTPGSFYTEPAGDMHFAETQDSAVVVQITGYGPSGTTYNTDNTPNR